MDEALIGRKIAGKFVIESHIGDGAMGAVYKAHQIALEKTIAIKVLHPGLAAADNHLAARFHREARAASRLNHPGSVQIIDFGEEPDGLLYLAMELAEGRNLHDIACDEAPFEAGRIVNILSQVLAALAVAHEMGVIHRDLKPENIIVLDGVDDEGKPTDVVKVCDFGIATIAEPRSDRSAGAASFGTAAGAIVGTPEYMSPEQARGEPLDPRSDLYSLGIVLFRLMTGALPFHAETALGVVLKQITAKPPRPSSIEPNVDPELEAICVKAMSKEPADRYESARDMRAALRSAVGPTSRPRMGPAPVSVRSADPSSAAPLAPTLEIPKTAVEAPAKPRWLPSAIAFSVAGLLVIAALVGSRDDPAPLVEVDTTEAKATLGAEVPEPAAEAPAPKAEAQAQEEAAPHPPEGEPEDAPTSATERPPSAVAARAGAPANGETAASAEPPLPSAEPSTTQPVEPSPPPSNPIASPPPVGTPAEAATAKPTAAPPPTGAAPLPPFDPSRARVQLASVSAAGGIPAAEARSAIKHAAFTSCYQGALKALGRSAGGTASLHLAIDETGRIRSASVSGMGFLPSAKSCIESAARAIRVRNVDTGDATADATLTFLPE